MLQRLLYVPPSPNFAWEFQDLSKNSEKELTLAEKHVNYLQNFG
jgi:hypothetical protein